MTLWMLCSGFLYKLCLKKSNEVIYNGLRIGSVVDMYLNDVGTITIEMDVEGNVPITLGSTATIVSKDLLGSKAIEISINTENDKLITDGAVIKGLNQSSLEEQISKEILPVKVKVDKLLGSLDTLTLKLQYLLKEENVDNGVRSFQQSMDNIQAITNKVNALVLAETESIDRIIKNVESISEVLGKSNETLSASIKNVEFITGNVGNITDSLQKADLAGTVNNAKLMITESQNLLHAINNGEGSLGLLIHDNTLYNNLNVLTNRLDSLVKSVDENGSWLLFDRKKRKENKKLN